jgi:phage shock protein C
MIFGVCQGIADWKGINAGYVRLTMILLTVFTGFFPFGLLYIAAAFFLPLEPAYKEKRFRNFREEFDDMASRFSGRDRDRYNREKDWDSRFNEERG